MKLAAIIEAQKALPALLQIPVPALTGYKLRKIRNFIQQEAELFHEERNALIMQHGTADGQGGYNVTDPEAVQAFYAAINPLAEKEIPCDLEKLTLAELADAKVPTIVWDQFAPFIDDTPPVE